MQNCLGRKFMRNWNAVTHAGKLVRSIGILCLNRRLGLVVIEAVNDSNTTLIKLEPSQEARHFTWLN